MPAPRVLVLYNEPVLPVDHPDADSEHDVLYTADVVARNLKRASVPVRRLGVCNDMATLVAGLKAHAPDVVFNLYEGTAKWGNTEAYVAGILEWLRIPFTGSPTQPLGLCRSKSLTKTLLSGSGLPTARFFAVDGGPCPANDLGWPVIVKPGTEDASVGIDQASVVTCQEQLAARVDYVRKTYGGPALVEQFVRGREFNVALIEREGRLDVLPFSEILFLDDGNPAHWPIVSFDAKWRPGTRDFDATPAKNPADVDPELERRVSDLARQAFRLVGCRDYARVDFRVDAGGKPYILEINPNPCISPLAGLAAGLESAKIPYQEFILGLVRSAVRRGPRPELADSVLLPPDRPAPEPRPAPPPREKRVKVRPARASDREFLSALLSSADGLSATERRTFVEQAARLTRRNRPADSALLVAGDAGMVLIERSDATNGAFRLSCLQVAPAARGHGLGRELLRAAEAFAAEGGGRFVQVDVSGGPADVHARLFLTRQDYFQTGDVLDYYRDGSSRLTFVKHLPAQATKPTEPVPAVAPVQRG